MTRRTVLALLGAVVLGACSGIDRRAVIAPKDTRVEQTYYVKLGGLDQWISIRGDDMRNPILLVVHGGPGEAQWPVLSHYREWEKSFTVVHWDQRGAGHTYGRHGAATPDVTLDRISNDGVELAEHLCREFDKKKIVVLGHSWGSIVGVTIAQRRPELIAAYVGTGQVGSWKGAVKAKFDFALAKARADGNAATVEELQGSGPPAPDDAAKVFAFNDRLFPYWAPSDVEWIKSLRAGAATVRASDPKNFKDFEDGFRFSAERMVPDQMKTDLPSTAGRIDTALFVLQGRDDLITPTQDASDYFDRVQAPHKKLVLIPDAGHFAFMTAPEAFLSLLTNTVRPVAIDRGA